jgi:hypothetical protein
VGKNGRTDPHQTVIEGGGLKLSGLTEKARAHWAFSR